MTFANYSCEIAPFAANITVYKGIFVLIDVVDSRLAFDRVTVQTSDPQLGPASIQQRGC